MDSRVFFLMRAKARSDATTAARSNTRRCEGNPSVW